MSKEQQEKQQQEKIDKPKKGNPNENKKEEAVLIRILGKDVHSNKTIMAGLNEIKGISWSFGSGLCKILNIDKKKRISDLTDDEITKIEGFIVNPQLPKFMLNRQKDFDDGKDMHLHGEDIKLRKEFDIKRLKKIRSYKGQRHTLGQPVRGQRTKSHFRNNRKKSGAVGVSKKKPAAASPAPKPAKK